MPSKVYARVHQISMANIKSAVEVWLRSVSSIPDDREVKISFDTIGGMTVTQWDKLEVVPIRVYEIEDEGVISHKINGG